MKVRIEIDDTLLEDEITIRCASMNDDIYRMHKMLLEQASASPKLTLNKGGREYYLPSESILFFETDGETVYAHTESEAFSVKERLYELEALLPRHFLRIAKSTIVNLRKIRSIKREVTASCLVEFAGTHKQIYASRSYARMLRERMSERSGQ